MTHLLSLSYQEKQYIVILQARVEAAEDRIE